MVPILVLLTCIAAVVSALIISRYRERAKVADWVKVEKQNYTLAYPANYLLFNNHVWLKQTLDESYTLGLDELLHNFLGVPDQIYLKNKGDKINKGDQLAVFKKGNKEVYLETPIAGTIKQVNDSLLIHPDKLTSEPYDRGWLYMVDSPMLGSDKSNLKFGLAAHNWLKSEFVRMKEFLLQNCQGPVPEVSTLMDGGWPVIGVIENLDQETVTLFEKDFMRVEKKEQGNG